MLTGEEEPLVQEHQEASPGPTTHAFPFAKQIPYVVLIACGCLLGGAVLFLDRVSHRKPYPNENASSTTSSSLREVGKIATPPTRTEEAAKKNHTPKQQPPDPPLTEKDGGEPYRAPPPSQEDWCMAPGSYQFFGTYRSPQNEAEDGFFFAPGRFQGTVLTGQTDKAVYFHLVNMTYGNVESRHHYQHVPGKHDEPDMFDTFCTIHPKKPSACYTPKFFSPRHAAASARDTTTRCGKLEFPSQNGYALCRQLAVGEFVQQGTATLGVGTNVEEWVAHLSKMGDPKNDYDGELRLYMQNLDPAGTFKVPLTHWLASDDQTLETSFQIMNRKSWDPTKYPEIPKGCEDAIDIADLAPHKLPLKRSFDNNTPPPSPKTKKGKGRRNLLGCPFGAMHREMILPSILLNLQGDL